MPSKLNIAIKKIRSNDFWKKLFTNVSTIVLGQGGAAGFNMITVFLVVALLGPGEYGALVIGQTYMQLIDLLVNFQSWQGVIRYGAKSIVEKRQDELASIVKAAFLVDVISAIAGTLLALGLANIVGAFMGYETSIISLCFLFSMEIIFHIEGTPTGVLRLFDKFNYVAIHAVILAIVKLIACMIALCYFKGGLLAVACAYIVSDIIKYISLFCIACSVVHKRIGITSVIKADLNQLPHGFVSFTVWTNFAEACDAPIQYFDVFFLSLLSTEVVGVFKFFKQILSVASLLSKPIQQAIMPQLAELIAKGDGAGAYRAVVKIRKATFKVFMPVIIMVSPFIPVVLGYFMDPIYASYWYLFLALAVLTLVGVSYSALHPCFAAYGFAKASVVITAIANISYCVIAFLFLQKIGIMGIPIAMSVQYFLTIYLKISFIKRKIPNIRHL